jgi:hypothetical protein
MSETTINTTIDTENTEDEFVETIENDVDDETAEVLGDEDTADQVDPSEALETEDEVEPVEATDETTLEQMILDILDADEFSGLLTMYQVAKVLNTVLELFEVTKKGEPYRVRPQMVYNYNGQKMVVKGVKVDKATPAQAYEFVLRFVSKHLPKAAA